MKKSNHVLILFILLTSLFVSSCSSIFNGSLSEVDVKSTPSDAKIIVNGSNMGKTPSILKLKRGETHVIEIQKDGYQTYKVTTTNTIAGWFWGNLLCGGVVGIVIDLVTGNAYDVSPRNINANLDKGTASIEVYEYQDFGSIIINDENGNTLSTIEVIWE